MLQACFRKRMSAKKREESLFIFPAQGMGTKHIVAHAFVVYNSEEGYHIKAALDLFYKTLRHVQLALSADWTPIPRRAQTDSRSTKVANFQKTNLTCKHAPRWLKTTVERYIGDKGAKGKQGEDRKPYQIQSGVNTLLLSYENHSQNGPLPTPKTHNISARHSQIWQECFYSTLYIWLGSETARKGEKRERPDRSLDELWQGCDRYKYFGSPNQIQNQIGSVL